MLLTLALVGTVAAGGGEERASEVMARMREALRRSSKAEAVRSLSMEADLRRLTPEEGSAPREMAGEVTVEVLLPDRYLKVETLSPFPGAPAFSVATGHDGQEAWRAPVGVPPGHGMVVRVQSPDGPAGAASLRKRTRAELTRVALLSLGAAPEGTALTFGYAGEAEAPEGRAHVLEVTGPDDFSARLFVDTRSNLPLFISFRGQLPRLRAVRAQGPDAAHAREEAERAAATAAAPVPEVEMRLFVSEFRDVGGVMLPHRFLQEAEGGPSEEWTVKKWKVNPPLKAEAFRKQG
jgi:hypothetical protein